MGKVVPAAHVTLARSTSFFFPDHNLKFQNFLDNRYEIDPDLDVINA